MNKAEIIIITVFFTLLISVLCVFIHDYVMMRIKLKREQKALLKKLKINDRIMVRTETSILTVTVVGIHDGYVSAIDSQMCRGTYFNHEIVGLNNF